MYFADDQQGEDDRATCSWRSPHIQEVSRAQEKGCIFRADAAMTDRPSNLHCALDKSSRMFQIGLNPFSGEQGLFR
jgi:hypothetical protein